MASIPASHAHLIKKGSTGASADAQFNRMGVKPRGPVAASMPGDPDDDFDAARQQAIKDMESDGQDVSEDALLADSEGNTDDLVDEQKCPNQTKAITKGYKGTATTRDASAGMSAHLRSL